MAFPSDTCFRVGGDFFTEGWRVSSVFADVVSPVLRNGRFIISGDNFLFFSVMRVCLHQPLFNDETDDESDTVSESFSSILCDDD